MNQSNNLCYHENMAGIFSELYQEKLVDRAVQLGIERGSIGGFEKFLAAMHPDGATDLATITTSRLAEPGYAGILRLHTWSIEKGIAASSGRGDEYQDRMREAISDTIRSAGRQLRSKDTDERFVVQFQMRLLGGVIKGLINRSHDIKVPELRGFASSLIRKDFIDLCKGSGVLPEVSPEWIQSAGKALFGGSREQAIEYANQLANLDKEIFLAN